MDSDELNYMQSKRASDRFTMILNEALRDSRLSWRAKGILAGCLTHVSDFRFNKAWILSHGTEGRDAVTAALAELRDLGYLENKVKRCEKTGKVIGRELVFRDQPTERLETRRTGNQATGKPSDGKPVVLRRPINQENQIQETPLIPPTDSEPVEVERVPAPTTPTKRALRFKAKPENVPRPLQEASELACAYFNDHKGGQHTSKAFQGLLTQLELIRQDRGGGIEAVKEQLRLAIEVSEMGGKKWQCIMYKNWEMFGKRKVNVQHANERPHTQVASIAFEEDTAEEFSF